MSKSNTIQKTKLLIVEGNHERDFFEAWLRILGTQDIQVMPIGGKYLLRDNLTALVKQRLFPTVTSMVVVRDADDNPAGAFDSVCSALTSVGLTRPSQVYTFTPGMPAIAVVIVPGANRSGALEELLLETVDVDPVAVSAQTFITDTMALLATNGLRNPPPAHRYGKACTHAFLATFEEPDKDLGKAALSGVWNFQHGTLIPILQVLQQM